LQRLPPDAISSAISSRLCAIARANLPAPKNSQTRAFFWPPPLLRCGHRTVQKYTLFDNPPPAPKTGSPFSRDALVERAALTDGRKPPAKDSTEFCRQKRVFTTKIKPHADAIGTSPSAKSPSTVTCAASDAISTPAHSCTPICRRNCYGKTTFGALTPHFPFSRQKSPS
jgi:hypothetical protein